jgi:hypothetical protein
MKEELQGKLVEILTSIQTAAGKASDFAMEQLPDIAQSYVLYGRVVETAEFAIPFSLVVVFAWALLAKVVFANDWIQEDGYNKGNWPDSRITACAALGTMLPILMLVTAVNFAQFAMVWFSPKVWLLKEIAALIK